MVCWVDAGVGNGAATSGACCSAVVSLALSEDSSVGFGAGLVGGGGPAGRRRGGAFGATFLPDVAELIKVDILFSLEGHRAHEEWWMLRRSRSSQRAKVDTQNIEKLSAKRLGKISESATSRRQAATMATNVSEGEMPFTEQDAEQLHAERM